MPQEKPLITLMEPYLTGKLTVPEIAKKTGKSETTIFNAIYRNGLGPRVKWRNRVKSHGRIHDVFLPTHIHAWVLSQCPKGTRVDEMVTAIVTDAYYDAMEQGK